MKLLMTGSNGTIGRILTSHLEAQHTITSYDLPDQNVLNEAQLSAAGRDQDAIIHLAWNSRDDNWRSNSFDPFNLHMAEAVYRAAVVNRISRVIMASSVHAHNPSITPGKLHEVSDVSIPDSQYGASKCWIESRGRYYASEHSIGVVCLRFGGVNRANKPAGIDHPDRPVWLSHADCASLVDLSLRFEKHDNNFVIVQGVSANSPATHDYENTIGWKPADGIVDN